MSKKSRKRNKKILAALALAGGAAMLAKGRGKGEISSNRPSGIDAAPKTDWIAKKLAAPVETAPISKNIFRTRHRLTDSAGNTIPKNHMANIAAMSAPKGILPPGSVPVQRTGPGPRRFAKGGKVTGIAKRGFGRALMKGKK